MDPNALATLGTALGTLRTLVGLARDVNKIELTDKIFELQSQLLQVQQSLSELQEENRRLLDENRELKELKEIKGKLIFSRQVYWLMDGDTLDGPYCPICWGDKQKLIRPVEWDSRPGETVYRCVIHDTYFTVRKG